MSSQGSLKWKWEVREEARGRRFQKDLPWLALMLVEGGPEPRNVASLKIWQGKGVASPLAPPENMQPCPHLTVAPKPMIRHLTWRTITGACVGLSRELGGDVLQQQRNTNPRSQ